MGLEWRGGQQDKGNQPCGIEIHAVDNKKLLLLICLINWLHWETSSGDELGCLLQVTFAPVQLALLCCCSSLSC